MAMEILPVSVLVSTPGGNLELNAAPYQLAGETFSSIAVSHRKQAVTNPFVEGSYTVNALRENMMTPVSLWVRGATQTEMQLALDTAKAAFDQSMFTMRITVDGWTQQWQCFASDYTIGLQREYLHAVMALLDVQVDRHPGAPGWTNLASALVVED
jgi:hypothetical protein